MSHDHGSSSSMDMDMDISGTSASSAHTGMNMIFFTASNTPLYATGWTPSTPATYAGTCIFLILLAVIFRSMFVVRTILERRWLDSARKRRYIVVKGAQTEAQQVDADPQSREAKLVTAQGVEENVRVVNQGVRPTMPFRLSVDVPRAVLSTVIAGTGYLLMLAVMTMNVGYFMSVLGGTFIGELAMGRYSAAEEH